MKTRLLNISVALALLWFLTDAACTVEETAPVPADVAVDVAPVGPALELLDDGLMVDGVPLVLATPLTATAELLGEAEQIREMGPAGTVHSYPSLGLEFWVEEGDLVTTIHVLPAYTGSAASGVVPGADEALVAEKLGPGVAVPFGMGSHYPDRGLFVGLREGKVELLTLRIPE